MPRSTRNEEGSAVAEREPVGRDARRTREGGSQSGPTTEDIARRAYEIYRERGGTDGQEVEDWLRAEAELREGRGRRDDEV